MRYSNGGKKRFTDKKTRDNKWKTKTPKPKRKAQIQKEKRDIMDFLAIKDNLQNSLKAINNQSKKIKNNISRLNKMAKKSIISLFSFWNLSFFALALEF